MIFCISINLLSIVGGLLALMLAKDLIWLLKSLKYIKQGIPHRYFPFVGYAKYFDNPEKEEGLEDFHQLFQKSNTKGETEKLIQVNGLTTVPTIFLNDKDMVKEFFQKETEVSFTQNGIDFPAKKTFMFSPDGHRVQKDRAIFSEIFFAENLAKHTPKIRAIIQRHLNQIKSAIKQATIENTGQSETEKAEIELKPFINNIFTDIVSFVLFGGEIPEIDGVLLATQIITTIGGYFKNRSSFMHIATRGLATKIGLDTEFNHFERLYYKIIKKLKDVVKERENSKDYIFGRNAIDLLILKNRELEAQGKGDKK